MINGILNLYKPVGLTSHDVVAKVRRSLREKRVGHAGTLDPAAEGVLPVCVGQATRVVEYLSDARKIYCAEIRLGITTDTYDREGMVTRVSEVPNFSLEELEQAVARFRGPIEQVPPLYSAIKVGGQPLYKMARAGKGDQVELKPRPVEIFTLEITALALPFLKLWVECSKGTYIRSLAFDLGTTLGCGAYMQHLVRLQSGPFQIKDTLTLEELQQAAKEGTEALEEYLYPLDTVLTEWPAWIVNDATAERIRQGRDISPAQEGISGGWQLNKQVGGYEKTVRRVYTAGGELLALMERVGEGWHPAKVFIEKGST
ncbi:MAG: tRNA pseudouridine(55) synthase TruB [Chloroflexota bacterium]|nr:tRNA pseudouridine(55) synthase TruB [Chloroflexota bacterium]